MEIPDKLRLLRKSRFPTHKFLPTSFLKPKRVSSAMVIIRLDEMIDLYTSPTPHGWKASITLEELHLPDKIHAIELGKQQQNEDWFLKINPNGRIPAFVDHDSGDLAIFESGAIFDLCRREDGQAPADNRPGRSQPYDPMAHVPEMVASVR